MLEWKNTFETMLTIDVQNEMMQKDGDNLSGKKDKNHIEELKNMIQDKKSEETVEEVFSKFCERHAVSMGTCKEYYEKLVEKGEVKKE